MSHPIIRISEILCCSEEDAREFCVKVQRVIGNNPPPYRAIADFLTTAELENPNIEIVAESLVKAGWDRKTKMKRSAKKTSKRGKIGSSVRNFRFWNLPDPEEGLSSSSREAGVESRSVFDKDRLPLHKAKKCPHGVPTILICAICNPKGFRKMTGID